MPKGRLEVISTDVLGFERVPISLRMVGKDLALRLENSAPDTVLAVDMAGDCRLRQPPGIFRTGWVSPRTWRNIPTNDRVALQSQSADR